MNLDRIIKQQKHWNEAIAFAIAKIVVMETIQMHEDGIKEWMRYFRMRYSRTKRCEDYQRTGIQIKAESSKKQNQSEYSISNEYFIKCERWWNEVPVSVSMPDLWKEHNIIILCLCNIEQTLLFHICNEFYAKELFKGSHFRLFKKNNSQFAFSSWGQHLLLFRFLLLYILCV